MLFHGNEIVRQEARKKYENYVDIAMKSAYGQDLTVIHKCGKKESRLLHQNKYHNAVVDLDEDDFDCLETTSGNDQTKAIEGKADDLFYDFEEGHSKLEQLQHIRTTRSKHKKHEIQGKILHCYGCNAMFSTTEIVNMILSYHKASSNSNVRFPIHDN